MDMIEFWVARDPILRDVPRDLEDAIFKLNCWPAGWDNMRVPGQVFKCYIADTLEQAEAAIALALSLGFEAALYES